MTKNKRFTTDNGSNEDVCLVDNLTKKEYESNFNDIVDVMNNLWGQTQRFEKHNKDLMEENEQLRNRLKDWHQKTFKAHEYFNILEKVIDEVCNDDISNQIWKEYEKREKLIE